MGLRIGYILVMTMLAGVTLVSSSCECVDNEFYFSIPYTIAPTIDSVRLGDTVWVSASASETMIDSKTQQSRSVVDANISLFMSVFILSGPNVITGGVAAFDFVVAEGARTDVEKFVVDRFVSVNFAEKNGLYSVRVGAVCKTKGQFSFDVVDVPNVRPKGYSQCEEATFTFPITNADNHLYILQNTTYQGMVIQDIVAKTSYCFTVY